MREEIFSLEDNKRITKDVVLLTLKGNTSSIKGAGQFVNIKLKNQYLRRPISIFNLEENKLQLLVKILGNGTLELSNLKKGEELSILIDLGNGFDLTRSKKPLLIGGGIGIAPLYELGKEFNKLGIKPTFIFGFKNKDEIMMIEEYSKFGEVIITTDDGSYGYKGNPVNYLNDSNNHLDYDHYYACGPLIMLKFLTKDFKNGDVSLEARMGCGFGACMGCSIKTTNGFKRVCKEGPVFKADEVIYE